MYYFYVLKSLKDGKLYKGYSQNVRNRLLAHNSGKVRATKNRKPFKIIYQEGFNTEKEAIEREKYFKTFKGGKKLKKILDNRE